ncbi:hypothetical protein [Jiella sp. M17.18]|uniref:hypothetical protein n=1 Tax=Jiella sp. M17.18 TaxID=3234247 RepID=UPI0034E00AC6
MSREPNLETCAGSACLDGRGFRPIGGEHRAYHPPVPVLQLALLAGAVALCLAFTAGLLG